MLLLLTKNSVQVKRLLILIFFSILLLSACNKILYETPMPSSGEIVDDIPHSFLGDFISIHFSEHYVEGEFKSVTKVSDKRYRIETTDAVYVDSLYWKMHIESPIVHVSFVNSSIEIFTDNKVYTKDLRDTLSSKPKRIEYELDFNQGYIYENFYDAELHEESKLKFELRFDNRNYFLNRNYGNKYWMPTRIEGKRKDFYIKTTNFSIQGENEKKFNQLKAKYNFRKIEGSKNKGISWDEYLANPDDAELNKILDDDLFGEFIWHRINKQGINWMYTLAAILLLLGLLFLLRRN